jgi:hypothetical protein
MNKLKIKYNKIKSRINCFRKIIINLKIKINKIYHVFGFIIMNLNQRIRKICLFMREIFIILIFKLIVRNLCSVQL